MNFIDQFVEYLLHTKRYSEHTVLSYKTDLSQFFAFRLDTFNESELHTLTHHQIREWIVENINMGLNPKSINRKITSLKSFYKYLNQQDITDINPTKKIDTLKVSKQLPLFLKNQEIEDLFSLLNEEHSFVHVRNKIIFQLLYSTGIRRSELIKLKDKDIDFSNATLKVLGKRSKERVIPMTIGLSKSIKEYMLLKKQENFTNLENNCYLILTSKGNKAYPKLVYQVVHDSLSKVSTLSKKSPHILRHSFATHLLNNGAELNAIKEILGHANLAATEVYTHTTFEKLKSIYNQAHPRAQNKQEE